jgi:hypothetical protein
MEVMVMALHAQTLPCRARKAGRRLGDGQGKNHQRTLAECLPHMRALTNSVQAL